MIALPQYISSFVINNYSQVRRKLCQRKKTSHRYKNDSVPEITDDIWWHMAEAKNERLRRLKLTNDDKESQRISAKLKLSIQ